MGLRCGRIPFVDNDGLPFRIGSEDLNVRSCDLLFGSGIDLADRDAQLLFSVAVDHLTECDLRAVDHERLIVSGTCSFCSAMLCLPRFDRLFITGSALGFFHCQFDPELTAPVLDIIDRITAIHFLYDIVVRSDVILCDLDLSESDLTGLRSDLTLYRSESFCTEIFTRLIALKAVCLSEQTKVQIILVPYFFGKGEIDRFFRALSILSVVIHEVEFRIFVCHRLTGCDPSCA